MAPVEIRVGPRSLRPARKLHAEPKPQRVTVRNRLTSRLEKPTSVTKPAVKTVAKKAGDETKPKTTKDLKEKIAKFIEPSTDGHYELNALMSGALEKELQNIMIKLWQQLPDSPSSSAEKLVTDKFRTDLGDDFKNVLGLNVTKRILDVTNPLYVKIEFDRQPFGDVISKFLRWLNCAAMKRVMDGQHCYIAQLRKLADLDRVISKPVVRIGGIKAKITPYYKFTKCPSRLKTVYKTLVKKTVKEKTESVDQEAKTEINKKVEADGKKEATDKKETATTTNSTQTPNTVDTETPTKEEQPKETQPKVKPKKVEQTNKNETKPVVKTPAASDKPATPNKVKIAQKVEATSKTAVTKPTTLAKPINKATPAKSINKTTAPAKATNKATPPAKATNKATPPAKAANKVSKVTNKTNTTKQAAKVTPNKAKQKKKGAFDELDDEDILALMSNAIVLDECVGSDDD